MGFTSFDLKLGNMKKAQNFVLYPYDGGDYILLQSDKRIARINIRTGKGLINAAGCNYPTMIRLQLNPISCELPEDVKTAIQEKLWHNAGK